MNRERIACKYYRRGTIQVFIPLTSLNRTPPLPLLPSVPLSRSLAEYREKRKRELAR